MKRKIKTAVLALFCLFLLSGCSGNGKGLNVEEICQVGSMNVMQLNYHNVVEKVKDVGSGIQSIGKTKRTYWLEYDGTVDISYDLKSTDVSIKGNTVTICVPEPTVVPHLPVDQDQPDPYISPDNWWNRNPITIDDQKDAFAQAKKEMTASVEDNPELIQNARKRYEDILETYITSVGEIQNRKYTVKFE